MTPSSKAPPRPSEDFLDLLGASRRAPLVMGIVNVTPDSFYAAGRSPERRSAIDRALTLVEQGADLLDIGGQSTRPGSEPVSEKEELRRVLPVVEAVAARVSVPISIDTDKAVVAREALKAGARIINDVSALRNDPNMTAEALPAQGLILMHRGGNSSKTMQDDPRYMDVVREVADFLDERVRFFAAAGGDPKRVLVDPGIGFGKTLEHNVLLLRNLAVLARSGRPVVLGVSRKSFLGKLLAAPGVSGAAVPPPLRTGSGLADGGAVPGPEDRLEGSLAVAAWAMIQGVRVLRVHDVGETCRFLRTLAAVAGSH